MITKEEFFNFAYTPAGNMFEGGKWKSRAHSWWCQQTPDELWYLLNTFQQLRPRKVLEIGSAHGGNLVFFDYISEPGSTIVGLTWPQDTAFSVQRYPGYYNYKGTVHGLEENTHLSETLQHVKDIFNGPIDAIFVDGDHSYEGCKQDYEMYSPLVRAGGIIGFHDLALEPGCRRAFDEVDPGKKREIFPVHYQGIGVIYT